MHGMTKDEIGRQMTVRAAEKEAIDAALKALRPGMAPATYGPRTETKNAWVALRAASAAIDAELADLFHWFATTAD